MKVFNVAKSIGMCVPDLLLRVGIILCFLSLTVSIYKLIRKQMCVKEALLYLAYLFVPGAVIAAIGAVLMHLLVIEIDMDTFPISMIFAYVLSIIIFAVMNHGKKNK